MSKLDISKIVQYPAPEKEFSREVHPKKQVVLHHTASGGNVKQDMDYLNTDNQGAVNCAFFINRDGSIWQAFSSKYWSAHLGVPQSTFTKFGVKNTSKVLHQVSIAIELDNWGYLTKKNGKFYSWSGTEVKAENVVHYPEKFLGYEYYEKYPDTQIKACKELVEYLCDTYKIDKSYQSNMWKVTKEALSGKNGVWTHVSFRESGKWDCHPQPELIDALKDLQ